MSVRGGPIKGQLMTLPGRKAKFLKHFSESGNLTESLAVAGLAKSTHYKLLENNHKYTEAFETACDVATDQLIGEARRRAVTGVVEKTGWYKGVSGGEVTKYSDNLLMFLLKERRPEYRDKWEVTGAGGQPLQIILQAYGSQEVANKGYKRSTSDPKESKDPDPDPEPGPAAPPIEVEAKGV